MCIRDRFNEAEVEAASKPEEPIVQKVDGYYRKPFRTKRAELIKDLPVREIPCDIPCDIPVSYTHLISALLFYEKVENEVLVALSSYDVVIVDRYIDSAICYHLLERATKTSLDVYKRQAW